MMRIVLGIGLLLAATIGPLASLGPLIETQVWWPAVVAAVGTAGAALLVLRLATRWVVLPTLIAAGAGFISLLAVESGSHGESLLRPSIDTLSTVANLVLEGALTLRTGIAPIDGGTGVALIVASVVLLLVIAAEALAIGADSPALAGAPLLLLWTPQIALNSGAPIGYLLLSAASYILLLAVAGANRVALPRVVPVASAVTALTIVCSLVVSPWALSSPSWLGGFSGGSTTRLDLGLDIRNDLVRGADTPLIAYQGLSPSELGPVHSHTLADFDGQRWHRDSEELWLGTAMLYPEGSRRMLSTESDDQSVTIQIADLGQDRLFLPEAPRQTGTPTLYDPVRDEVYSRAGSDVSYHLAGPPLVTDPEVWHEQSLVPGSPTDAERYLALPGTSGLADLEELTEEIIDGATSPYEKAVAIQDFFRTDDRFEYTTSVPQGDSDDAVWDFLDDGQGYCVQFATAMVMMARAAGIPARMAVGFLPGEKTTFDDGETGGVISSHDAHTWPQLFLGGAGWTRFEPTPGSRTGPVPGHSRGLSSQTPAEVPEEIPTGAPAPEPAPSVPQETSAPDPAPVHEQERSVPWWPAAVVLLVLAAAGARWAVHRRSVRDWSRWEPEDYWQKAVGVLSARGLRAEPGDTPSVLLGKAAELLADAEHADALEGFSHLTAAVNASRYAREPGAVGEDDLDRWLGQVTDVPARVAQPHG